MNENETDIEKINKKTFNTICKAHKEYEHKLNTDAFSNLKFLNKKRQNYVKILLTNKTLDKENLRKTQDKILSMFFKTREQLNALIRINNILSNELLTKYKFCTTKLLEHDYLFANCKDCLKINRKCLVKNNSELNL